MPMTPHELWMQMQERAQTAERRRDRIAEAWARGYVACLERVYPTLARWPRLPEEQQCPTQKITAAAGR